MAATTLYLLRKRSGCWSLILSACPPLLTTGRRKQDPSQHQALPTESPWAGVMLSKEIGEAFPARNTRQQVNLLELSKATYYKWPSKL